MKARLLAVLLCCAASVAAQERRGARLNERAHQDRDIVYFLQQPETHAFDLYHDYTESREGTDKYVNIVRPGSRSSNPSAYILDTGQKLKVETLKGTEITARKIDIREEVKPDTEIVVIWFDAVLSPSSSNVRIRRLLFAGSLA